MSACKDCEPTSKRPAPHPGPRCATHHRIAVRRTKRSRRASHVERTYGITAQEYQALMVEQGGRCAICRRATGASRALSVDHDHKVERETGSTREAVRGLLCRPCNDLLGHLRDDTLALLRACDYLAHPPAGDVLGTWGVGTVAADPSSESSSPVRMGEGSPHG